MNHETQHHPMPQCSCHTASYTSLSLCTPQPLLELCPSAARPYSPLITPLPYSSIGHGRWSLIAGRFFSPVLPFSPQRNRPGTPRTPALTYKSLKDARPTCLHVPQP